MKINELKSDIRDILDYGSNSFIKYVFKEKIDYKLASTMVGLLSRKDQDDILIWLKYKPRKRKEIIKKTLSYWGEYYE